jgi:hypothetical protein
MELRGEGPGTMMHLTDEELRILGDPRLTSPLPIDSAKLLHDRACLTYDFYNAVPIPDSPHRNARMYSQRYRDNTINSLVDIIEITEELI